MVDRVRVELRLSPKLVELVDDIAGAIGLRRNAIFAMAVTRLAVEMTVLYLKAPGAKREYLFSLLEKQLMDSLADARKTL